MLRAGGRTGVDQSAHEPVEISGAVGQNQDDTTACGIVDGIVASEEELARGSYGILGDRRPEGAAGAR